jgi:predicted nucleic acid-binding protein
MRFVEKKGILVEPTVKIEKSRDSNDNFLLELAETTQANYVITRDKDLLVLENWKDTIIIKPEDFLPHLRRLSKIN